MIRAHHAVARIHRRAFHNRQNVALHALARNVRPVPALASGNLVNLIEKDDAARLHALHGCAVHRVHVDEPALFFLHQIIEGVGHLHLALLGRVAKDVRQHVLETHLHVLKVLVADDAKLRRAAIAHVNLDHAIVHLALAKLLTQLLPRALMALRSGQRELALLPLRGRGRRRQQHIQQALLGVHLRAIFHLFQPLLAHHVNGDLHEVANHRFHVAAHITHLGKLRGLHFKERRIGQLREAARNLCLAHAGGPNHDDVLGHDVVGQVGRQLLAALAVPQRNGNGALGRALAHHVLVQLGDNLARRHLVEREVLFFGRCGKVDSHGFDGLATQSLALQLLNRDAVICINADFSGNLHGLFSNLVRIQIGIFQQRTSRRRCVASAAANRGNRFVGIDHIP